MKTNISRHWFLLCCAVLFLGLLLAGEGGAQTFFSKVPAESGFVIEVTSRTTAFGDYDNDGQPDAVFLAPGKTSPSAWLQIALLHNEGGRFTNHAFVLPEIPDVIKGGGTVFGDYDNDGDLDLFVPSSDWGLVTDYRSLNSLLRNDRGVFTNVTLAAGLTDELPTDNAIWLDYDRDGFLDLYEGNVGGNFDKRNILYRNNGDGTFVDATEEAGLDIEFEYTMGSNGGLLAGDFDDDGRTDLYVGVFLGGNRLFRMGDDGRFLDITTGDVGDPGEAFGVAVGDINNDGKQDIFQAAGGGSGSVGGGLQRSVMLLNLGGGEFVDVTEAVGLSSLSAVQLLGVGLGDVDNDGDLDLLTAQPHFLFLNNGDGTFIDGTPRSGITEDLWLTVSFGDYDLDGFLDVMFGSGGGKGLYRNSGVPQAAGPEGAENHGNHYLRVELAGVESNRSGIGARLTATSGDLVQAREIFGGRGYEQDELVAHFGLGAREKVDQLEIRWPSGRVDVLTDVPVDRKIRIIEGQGDYHMVVPTVWEGLPDSVAAGSSFGAAVRPALFERGAEISRVAADLSAFGGGVDVPLTAAGEGVYRLESNLSAGEETGYRMLSVMIDQSTSLGNYWTKLSRQIAVLPAGDVAVFDEELGDGWTVEGLELAAEETAAHRGSRAGHFQAEEKSFGTWSLTLRTAVPVNPFGYALRFALRFGEMGLPGRPSLSTRLSKGTSVNLLERVDLESREWQVVEIPLVAFAMDEPTDLIRFSGNIGGDFYLDDVRLMAARPSSPANTAVLEERIDALPERSTLAQNYPNPFNSGTSIRFGLAARAEVELAVFNLAGQQVVTLVEGVREMGEYAVRWDGRDDEGRGLASGVYLYRLRTGGQIEMRKLLLLQ